MTKQTKKTIGIIVIALFVIGVIYFFYSAAQATNEVPSYVTGDMRTIYTWAKTTEGKQILEQLPCYCGCKYEGHLHARHCFWKDDGTFDKHGVTCSVCLDIAQKAYAMHNTGNDICTIRTTIDTFYMPNKALATPTPMPEGCS